MQILLQITNISERLSGLFKGMVQEKSCKVMEEFITKSQKNIEMYSYITAIFATILYMQLKACVQFRQLNIEQLILMQQLDVIQV